MIYLQIALGTMFVGHLKKVIIIDLTIRIGDTVIDNIVRSILGLSVKLTKLFLLIKPRNAYLAWLFFRGKNSIHEQILV